VTDASEMDYYVSLRRDSRTALLAGPFATHTEALDTVARAVAKANEVDQWSHFDPFGTVSIPRSPSNPMGKLNGALGIIARVPY
jgi:hypothetical protein